MIEFFHQNDFLRRHFFDGHAIQFLQELFGHDAPLPFFIFSFLGDSWGMLLVAGLALWLWGREPAYAVIGAIAVGAVTKALLTEVLFYGPRPSGPGYVVYEQISTGSLPSGHLYMAIGAWGWLYARDHVPLAAVVAVAVMVAVGRLYLGAHYLGDILAGVIFGVLLAWAFYRSWPALYRFLRRRSFAFFLMTGVAAAGAAFVLPIYSEPSPHRMEVFGVAVGGLSALLLEFRYVRFRAAPDSWRRKVATVSIGVAGIVPFLVVDRMVRDDAMVVAAAMTACAAAWALLAAPALFQRMGWGESGGGESR